MRLISKVGNLSHFLTLETSIGRTTSPGLMAELTSLEWHLQEGQLL